MGRKGDRCGGAADGRRSKGDWAAGSSGTDDGETLALVSVALRCLERFVAGVVGVVHRGDLSGAANGEGDEIAGGGDLHTIFIGDGGAHVAHLVPTGAKGFVIAGKVDFGRAAGGLELVSGDNSAVVLCDGS